MSGSWQGITTERDSVGYQCSLYSVWDHQLNVQHALQASVGIFGGQESHGFKIGAASESTEKKTIRPSSEILDIQTASGIVVSDTQAKVYIKELGAYPRIHLVNDCPSVLALGREDCAMNLVILLRGR